MENQFEKLCYRLSLLLIGLVVLSSLFVSCKDDYPYDNEEPEWLGKSIYDYLVSNGDYTNFVKIIDDLDYKEVLARTGSKTLFVANDEAFQRFYKNNRWGVSNYNQLSTAQKTLILNFSMINNAYLIETLSNYYDGTLQEGSALRRVTAVSALDTIPKLSGNQLPATKYWDSHREKGLYLMKDNSDWPLVHLLQKVLDFNGISNSDFKVMTGIDRENGDAHIFSDKVIKRDIACKNGYVNVLENVLTPPSNMAQYIRTQPQLSEFSKLLDRFCAPYYDASNTLKYKKIHPDFADSLFTMKYFASFGGTSQYPSGATIPTDYLLPFDPGWNSYTYQYGSLQSDMAAMFAPTNKALDAYFNEGSGRALKERYGSWDNVPNDILQLLLTRHMRESLVNSLPGIFYKMVDSKGSEIKASASDIVDSLNYIGLNGLVYVTNKIYPPDDYVSVYGPVLFSKKTTVINWAIKKYLYHLYLNSMVNSYAFLAPTDEALTCYIDPVTYGSSHPAAIKFWYDASPSSQSVKATIFSYNKATGEVDYNDPITTVTDEDFIKSRLVRILDQSIIVSDFKNSSGSYTDGYYVSKDGNIIKANNVSGIGNNVTYNCTFQGGNDIKTGASVSIPDSGIYHQKNGTTFMVNKLCQTPFQSVYSILSDSADYPSFYKFFKICNEFPNSNVFVRKSNNYGIDYDIKFFNTFRYTVYVPTNEAIDQAYKDGTIVTWDYINSITNQTVKDSLINKMERFVRYHFQDNSVFIHEGQPIDQLYQTATIKNDTKDTYFNTYQNKFYRIRVKSNTSGGLDLTTETGETAHIDTSKGLYNILTRDYIFSLDPTSISSLTSSTYTQSQITTSSTAVIHQIDKVLKFE